MGFGQGSAGLNGTGFQLLVIIFMLLFGVTLGQIFLMPTDIVSLGGCFIQSFHWSCSRDILWRDPTVSHVDWFLEVMVVSAKSLYPYSCVHGFDGATVSISSIVDGMPCYILLVVLLSNANLMNSPCSILLRIKPVQLGLKIL
jgi:hypothetical protein